MRKFKHLSFTDRLTIEVYLKKNMRVSEIAQRLGVHRSTIYREIPKGLYEHRNSDYSTNMEYSATKAQSFYEKHFVKNVLKISNDPEYMRYLEYMVGEEKYSPGAILGEIKFKGLRFNTSISKTTFYKYIDRGVFPTLTNKSLPVKGRKRKYHKVRVIKKAPAGTSIEYRPEEILARDEPGHWEMDCVVGQQRTKAALLVLTERKSREEIIRKIPNKRAESVVAEIEKLEREYGDMFSKLFRTITVDNGVEFSDAEGLEKSCFGDQKRTKLYYCHPYTSCERGSNENNNKLIRRFYPKGTDFTQVSDEDIQRLQDWMNYYPRRIFGYACAADLWEEYVRMIS